MCQHVKNIELFGVPNSFREERRILCHNSSGSNQGYILNLDPEYDSVNICNNMFSNIFLIIYI